MSVLKGRVLKPSAKLTGKYMLYVGIFVLIKHLGNYVSIYNIKTYVGNYGMQSPDIVLHTLEVCLGNM